MKPKTRKSFPNVFHTWQLEDRDLETSIDQVRNWMQEVNQLGIPHFGETATRLRPLRDRMLVHFAREDQMIGQLADLYPTSSPEVDAVRRQASRDHDQLSERLDNLIERLDQVVPPFASWQNAMDEVELFVDALEQHEDQESENFRMLMPPEGQES